MLSDCVLPCLSQYLRNVCIITECRNPSIWYVFGEEKARPWCGCVDCCPCRKLMTCQAMNENNARVLSYFGNARNAEDNVLYGRRVRSMENLDPVFIGKSPSGD